MIRVPRERVPKPAALGELGQSSAEAGRVLRARAQFQGKPVEFSYAYKVYKHADVKAALKELFHGKCAYCETRYASSQPMDVEHWRPKGYVELDNGSRKPGYYWYASDWWNLLPSCIDCNRGRTLHDHIHDKDMLLGKANQFPLANEAKRLASHDQDVDEEGRRGVAEEPLLINPCRHEPADYFHYTDEAAVVPKPGIMPAMRLLAEQSIRVYALNRVDLVLDRWTRLQSIQRQLGTIEHLISVLDDSGIRITPRGRNILEHLLALEIEAVLETTRPRNEYSAMATQFVDAFAVEHGFGGRAATP